MCSVAVRFACKCSKFFTTRINRKTNTWHHCKAFGSETLAIMCFLNNFAKRVLDVRRVLVDQSECFKVMYSILWTLQSGDVAVSRAGELKDSFIQLHDLLHSIWGLGIQKIKSHLMHHLPRCLLHFGYSLNTFSNERRNKLLSMVSAHFISAGAEESNMKVLMCRMFLHLEHILATHSFEPIRMTHVKKNAATLIEYFPDSRRPYSCYMSRGISIRGRVVRVGDVISLASQDGATVFAMVETCLETSSVDGAFGYCIVARGLAAVEADPCSYFRTDYVDFVELENILNVYYKSVSGRCVQPLEPVYCV